MPGTGLLRALRAPPPCTGAAFLAAQPCGGVPAHSFPCQVLAASGLRLVPALPASSGPFPGVLLPNSPRVAVLA